MKRGIIGGFETTEEGMRGVSYRAISSGMEGEIGIAKQFSKGWLKISALQTHITEPCVKQYGTTFPFP